MPKVSIIIPTYNRQQFITRALECVFKQTFTDYEIIVIDDGSKDKTKEILEPYLNRINYIYQQNKGISAARNRGIEAAKGKYIAFLDSDDIWIPEKLTIQVDILESNPRVGLVYSKMIKINEAGEACGMKPENPTGRNFKELLEIGGDIPTSTVIARSECFEKSGLFDEKLPMMEDFEMWLRIAEHYDIKEVEGQILAYYYHHGEQVTKDKIKVYECLILLRQKILRTYSAAPKELLTKQIAESQYTLSRIYFKDHCYGLALKYLCSSIANYPLIGCVFIYKHDSYIQKLLKPLKPYVYLGICITSILLKGSNNHLLNNKPKKKDPFAPTVSIIVPIYNRVPYLQQAIDSILRQSYTDYEIVIVDDGSTEDITDEVQRCIDKAPKRIKFIRQENRGAGGARNKGIKESSGKIVAFLDSDDEWMDGFLESTVNKLMSDKYQWADTGANRVVLNDHEEIIEQKIIHDEAVGENDDLFAILLKNDIVGSPSKVVVKRSCFDKVGCFREDLRIREDWEMWLRLSKAGFKLGRTTTPLYKYKIRQNSLTKTQNLRGLRCTYRVLSDYSKDAFSKDPANRELYAIQMWDIARHLLTSKDKDLILFCKSIIKSQLYAPSISRILKSVQSVISGRY